MGMCVPSHTIAGHTPHTSSIIIVKRTASERGEFRGVEELLGFDEHEPRREKHGLLVSGLELVCKAVELLLGNACRELRVDCRHLLVKLRSHAGSKVRLCMLCQLIDTVLLRGYEMSAEVGGWAAALSRSSAAHRQALW